MPRGNGERGMFRRVAVASVPPGGVAALAQQTPATQLTTLGAFGPRLSLRRSSSSSRVPKRTRRAPRRAAIKPRKRVSSRKSRAYLVRGSAAAKRHMAKLRRMQKRRR